MLLTADVSMYPLQADYLPPIQMMIDKLNSYDGLKVHTSPTSTILVGEHDTVTNALSDAMRWSQEENGKAVFMVKFIPDYEAL